jgi:hypothetical protein
MISNILELASHWSHFGIFPRPLPKYSHKILTQAPAPHPIPFGVLPNIVNTRIPNTTTRTKSNPSALKSSLTATCRWKRSAPEPQHSSFAAFRRRTIKLYCAAIRSRRMAVTSSLKRSDLGATWLYEALRCRLPPHRSTSLKVDIVR